MAIILSFTLVGRLILGDLLGGPGVVLGLILGMILGITIVEIQALRPSSTYVRELIVDAEKIVKNWDGKYDPGRRFERDGILFLAIIFVNGAFWASIPSAAVPIIDPYMSLIVKFWSTYIPSIMDHYDQILQYSSEVRSAKVIYMYSTSLTIFPLLFFWRIFPAVRGFLLRLILKINVRKQRKIIFYGAIAGSFVALILGTTFITFGFGIEYQTDIGFVTIVPGYYMIGDTYWAFWVWAVALWAIGWSLAFLVSFFVVVRHWKSFHLSNLEGK
ncbi:MAG: hypothetical protein ACTSX7_13055 [Alphaproteobacteria bacterium]